MPPFSTEIQQIRAQLTEREAASLSSLKFQDDLLDLIVQNAETGDCIIEIGCYHGGLTAQLAFIAQRLGKRFISVDNDPSYIDIAEQTVKAVTPSASVNFFHGTFAQYVKSPDGQEKCILVFIDGMHTYEGVREDLEALYCVNPLPHIAVFHDFGLRANNWDPAVDRALFDSFGQTFKYHPIGVLGGPSSGLATKVAPGPWSDYFLDDVPEAVYIHCADCSLSATPSVLASA
jgi:hypothetical protein